MPHSTGSQEQTLQVTQTHQAKPKKKRRLHSRHRPNTSRDDGHRHDNATLQINGKQKSHARSAERSCESKNIQPRAEDTRQTNIERLKAESLKLNIQQNARTRAPSQQPNQPEGMPPNSYRLLQASPPTNAHPQNLRPHG